MKMIAKHNNQESLVKLRITIIILLGVASIYPTVHLLDWLTLPPDGSEGFVRLLLIALALYQFFVLAVITFVILPS